MENTRYKVLLIEDDRVDQLAFRRLIEEKDIPYVVGQFERQGKEISV